MSVAACSRQIPYGEAVNGPVNRSSVTAMPAGMAPSAVAAGMTPAAVAARMAPTAVATRMTSSTMSDRMAPAVASTHVTPGGASGMRAPVTPAVADRVTDAGVARNLMAHPVSSGGVRSRGASISPDVTASLVTQDLVTVHRVVDRGNVADGGSTVVNITEMPAAEMDPDMANLAVVRKARAVSNVKAGMEVKEEIVIEEWRVEPWVAVVTRIKAHGIRRRVDGYHRNLSGRGKRPTHEPDESDDDVFADSSFVQGDDILRAQLDSDLVDTQEGENRLIAQACLGHPDDVRDGRLMGRVSERQTTKEQH